MKKMKKVLSLFLALVMVLGMVNLSVFAVETSGRIESQKTDWTMTADGSVGHKKTIEKTGENTFKITLSVKTKEEIAQQVTSPDAAVVVVMDVSNSMAWTVDGKEAKDEAQQRITKAKDAAEKFIEDFAADAGDAQRQVALVEFGSNAMTVQGWTDAASAKNAVSRIDINFGTPACTIQGSHTHNESTIVWGLLHINWKCSECNKTVWFWDKEYRNADSHTHEKTYDGPHGKTTNDGGGTNIEGGLQLADNLLNTCPVTNGKKYVVLITDGVPTYHVYQDHYTQGDTNFIEGQKGGGNHAAQSDYKNVPTVANSIKSQGTLYTVSYASSTVTEKVDGKSIDAWLASFASKNVAAGDRIDLGLVDISETIKNQAQAWILTDPIPAPYIVYEPEDNANIPNADVNPNSVLNYKTTDQGTTLTWNLKNDTAKTYMEGNVKWYDYETSYVVHLDTTADGFEEDHPYSTNDTTTLTYMLTKDGVLESNLKRTNLVVPTVSGKLPTVGYTVKHLLKDKTTGEYVEQEQDTKTENAKLWDWVEPKANTYKNYTQVEGPKGEQQITQDGLVFEFKYDPDITSAVVNYHYELTIINEDGKTITNSVVNGTPVTGLFVGDEYRVEAPETSQFGDYTYSFDHADPGTTIKKLDKESQKNVINLYYKATIDERADASVVVDHVYTLHTYELKAGKYVAKDVVTEVPNVVSESGHKAGETYTASYYPTAGYSSYGFAGIVSRDNVKVLNSGPNVITLYFEDWEDPRGPELTLTVKHHYTKSVTEIVDGNVVTTVNPDNEVGRTDTITFYAGETVTIAEVNTYKGDTYNSDSGNASKTGSKTTTAADNGKEIKLYYSLTEEPQPATVTVEHIYQTVKHTTVTTKVETPVFDADGNPVMEDIVDEDGNRVIDHYETTVKVDEDGNPVLDADGNPVLEEVPVYAQKQKTELVDGEPETTTEVVTDSDGSDPKNLETRDLFEGQSYTATPREEANGYAYKESEDRPLTVTAPDIITIVYQRTADETEETQNDASIHVQHVYKTKKTTIVAGQVKTLVILDGEQTIDYVGKAGDSYTATPVTTFNGVDYGTSCTETTCVLEKGNNGTIVFEYVREDNSNLIEISTGYRADYVYKTYTMTVNESGVAGYWDDPVTETGTPVTNGEDKVYVGQIVNLPDGAKEGFTAVGQNPATQQTLSESNNAWTFNYEKYVPLDLATGTVRHIVTYKTLTVDENGLDKTEEAVIDAGVMSLNIVYKGETYRTQGMSVGTLTKVTVNGSEVTPDDKMIVTGTADKDETAVVFYYEVISDQRHPVNYSIQYYYYDVDYNGTETLTGEPPATTGSSFVGKTLDTTPEKEDIKGYKLAKAAFNGADILDQQSVTLVEGENKVVYVYKRTVDTRPETSVKVIHEYYASASAETPAFKDEEITNNLRAPSEFTATAKPTKNDVTYTQTTENSALTINLVENAGENVIVIKYVRANTSYQVVHEYYTDNVLSGSTNSVVAGEAGATITADGISKVLSYGGNSYSYTNASGAPLTLVQGENGTITLRYDRTTGSTWTPTGPDYYRLTINYVDEEGNVVAAQYVSGRHTSGWAYDVASPEVEGYTPRQAAVTGTLTRNTTLEVVYTKDVEIEDDNPPLAEPDTFKLTVHYVYADGSVAAEDSVKDGLLAGDSYSVTSPVLEGYTVDYELVAGTMPGEDLEFTVVYTPVETDVPEEQPPLVDVPDVQPPLVDVPEVQPPLVDVPDVQPPLVEWPDTAPVVNVPDEQPPLVEVPDEDVPMTGVPQTGDYSMVWYVAALLSALGLIVLTFKKREDEEG